VSGCRGSAARDPDPGMLARVSKAPEQMTHEELESYLWGAAKLLRGLIDAGDYKQYVFPLLFFKRLSDVWDEEYQTALGETGDESYARATADDRFVIPGGAHWSDVRDCSREVGRALLNAFRAVETANAKRLSGAFGNTPWTDKAQVPDETLKNLIEHFSRHTLSLAAVPEDELGDGYEYLIKQFADDSGHTAQEFYTNRTLVHLMVQMLEPQAGEQIYDPTVGTGGMLISALAEVKRRGGDTRTLGLYGQELIHITAAIARMNLVLHGVEDFDIVAGNTLINPAFIKQDRLQTFDVVLANPPYSIKKWNREAWQSDPWGRNFLGTPPQGRADYAFFQHILKSLNPKTGRCAILFPHGVLFRNEEAAMRHKLIESDLLECVLGLGPNLFYNSPMEACIVICRAQKSTNRRGKVVFIDAVHEVARDRALSFLRAEHRERIVKAYRAFEDEPEFATVATIEDILSKDANLSIPRYVRRRESAGEDRDGDLRGAWATFDASGREFWLQVNELVDVLDSSVATEARDV
jgi:type I restriction enzyme M protein